MNKRMTIALNEANLERLAHKRIQARIIRNDKRRARKAELVADHGGVCIDCRQSFPVEVYHFHHVEPTTKSRSVSTLLSGSDTLLLNEAYQCVIVCANCHIIRHLNEREQDRSAMLTYSEHTQLLDRIAKV